MSDLCCLCRSMSSGSCCFVPLASAPAKTDPSAPDREALHTLNGTLRVHFANELHKATAFPGWYLDVLYFSEGHKECLERLFRNERRKTTDEYGGVAWIERASGELARAAISGLKRRYNAELLRRRGRVRRRCSR